MYLNLFAIKLNLLDVLELVGVLPGVRDQVLLGHHQLHAVVVVHSKVSGTFKYKSLAGIVWSKSHDKSCLATVWAEDRKMWSCSWVTSLTKWRCTKKSKPRISWWRLLSMRYPRLKNLETEKVQSEGIEVKYKQISQRRLGTRLTPDMERQTTTKLRVFGIKAKSWVNTSPEVHESKDMLGGTKENISDLSEIGKLEYEGPRPKDKCCEGSGEVQEQANKKVQNEALEILTDVAGIVVKISLLALQAPQEETRGCTTQLGLLVCQMVAQLKPYQTCGRLVLAPRGD